MIRLPKYFAAALVVALLIGLSASARSNDVKGKIASVRLDQNELVLTQNIKNMTFQVNNDTKIFLNDRGSKLTELRPGDEAAITYNRVDGRLVAVFVHCVRRDAGNQP